MYQNIRYVMVHGVKYFRQENMVNFILELSSGEETDVRNRLTEAAVNLNKRSNEDHF